MRAKHWVGFLLVALIGSACGDDSGSVPTHHRDPTASAGKGGTKQDASVSMHDASDEEPPDAAVPTKPGDSGTAVAPSANPLAPVVEIIEPKTLKDPNSGDVLTSPLVTVRCKVTKSMEAGAQNVNEAGVKITLINADPKKSIDAAVKNAGNGEYTADFDLSERLNGPIEFACAAGDVSKPPIANVATVDTFLDLGPSIELLEPGNGTPHALTKSVSVDFRISDSPVSLDDEQATTTDIHLLVTGQEFNFDEDKDEKGLYHASIDFNSRERFPMAPSSAEIVVTAKSSRMPTAAERHAQADITVDADGPDIQIVSPKDKDIRGGDVIVQLKIADPSGVDPSSVKATIELGNADSYVLEDWTVSGDTYTDHFDTRRFDSTLIQLTINVEASDNVGNSASPGAIIVWLDNVPPLISLAPPFIREYKIVADLNRCSEPFDPVGSDAANDLEVVTPAKVFRAMLWDRTNEELGQTVLHVRGIDNTTVFLYAQPDLATPLLVDTDHDLGHKCDDINFSQLPMEQRPVVIKLDPITRKGSAPYSLTPNFADTRNVAPMDFCSAPTQAVEPDPLCSPVATQMTRAIGQPLDTASPPGAIYGLDPTNAATGACNGESWAGLDAVGREGWTCVAAAVSDGVGNLGISTPLRVCFDDQDASNGTPDCSEGIAPACTDGCALPDRFPNNMVLLQR